MNFIDLFAGLGGFHSSLSSLGHTCVFASEIKTPLRKLYKINFNIDAFGDINQVDIKRDIPPHNILCAGFPCQPFSKAGNQLGLEDERGNLFYKIMEILKEHTPEYIILENVPNLKSHDNGNTWSVIDSELKSLYDINSEILSPHQFGVPQHRSRIYIVGRLITMGGLRDFKFPTKHKYQYDIHKIIDPADTDRKQLSNSTLKHLSVWQDFLNHIPREEVPSFPIWAMEFGADYPYEKFAPTHLEVSILKKYKGRFGQPIFGSSKEDCLKCLPIYANPKKKSPRFPDWKIKYIKQNRDFYNKHKIWLDEWIPKVINFENSHQKFEWNCGHECNVSLDNKIIQYRPSGIRAKNPTVSPALVLSTTQTPIFPWVNGYMTIKEAAKLQNMENLLLPDSQSQAFSALGNAVNVHVVILIAQNLIRDE